MGRLGEGVGADAQLADLIRVQVAWTATLTASKVTTSLLDSGRDVALMGFIRLS